MIQDPGKQLFIIKSLSCSYWYYWSCEAYLTRSVLTLCWPTDPWIANHGLPRPLDIMLLVLIEVLWLNFAKLRLSFELTREQDHCMDEWAPVQLDWIWPKNKICFYLYEVKQSNPILLNWSPVVNHIKHLKIVIYNSRVVLTRKLLTLRL